MRDWDISVHLQFFFQKKQPIFCFQVFPKNVPDYVIRGFERGEGGGGSLLVVVPLLQNLFGAPKFWYDCLYESLKIQYFKLVALLLYLHQNSIY